MMMMINKLSLVPIRLSNYSKKVNFTFWSHLTTWSLMTLDLGIWTLIPWTGIKNEGSHIISMTQFQLKSITACWNQSQMLTCFHNNNRRQQHTKWSHCVFPAKAGNTKTVLLLLIIVSNIVHMHIQLLLYFDMLYAY